MSGTGVASWRLALRIARREAQRNRGRSLLILAMIALPVVGLSAADVVIRTADLDQAEVATRTLGTADLSVQLASDRPVVQQPSASYPDYQTDGDQPFGVRQDPALPPGSTVTPLEEGQVRVRTTAGEREVNAVTLDAGSPLVTGIVRLLDGRLPSSAGEVAMSPSLVDRTAAGPGARLWLADGSAYDVVGVGVTPDRAGDDALFAPPETFTFPTFDGLGALPPPLLVDLPTGTDIETLRLALNEAGYIVMLRDWILNPGPVVRSSQDTELAIGLTTVTVGLAWLQVILLAGAAFAVGARRQRRALGLYAATGGTPKDTGRTVLAGGLILGLVAAVVGVLLGLALAWPLRIALERQLGTLYGDWHIHWLELAAVALLGVLTGVLSALFPARAAARQDPLRALLQRPDPPRSGLRLTAGGFVLIGLGLAVTVFGATRQSPSYSLILGGAVGVELGFVLCAPALVGAAGRLARPLPVPLRMALRDASRHRSRSGPAVAAVMAALAGCVSISIFFVSQEAQAEQAYQPTARPGQITLSAAFDISDPTAGLPTATQRALTDAVPDSTLVSWQPLNPTCDTDECDSYVSAVAADGSPYPTLQPVIGGPDLLRAALGRADPAAERALADGEIVALDPAFVRAGQLTLETTRYSDAGANPRSERRDAPATSVAGPEAYTYALALMTADTAAELGLVAGNSAPQYLLDTTAPPTADQEDRLTALSGDGAAFYFQVERGYTSPAGPVLLALLGASVVVVLGATTISTGLAAADGRADLSTLAAVGASPRTRRLLAMSQAAVVAFLGAVLGALAGFVPAAALVETLGDWPLTIPWSVLGTILVVVPLIAAGFAGLFTRSRLPMLRRTA